MSNDQPEQTEGQPTRKSLIGPILSPLTGMIRWVRRTRFNMMLATGISVVLVLSVVLQQLWVNAPKTPQALPDVTEALAKLDEGDHIAAKDLAIKLHADQNTSYEDLAIAAFVLGVVTWYQADEREQWVNRKQAYLLASRYLEEAQLAGFPEKRKSTGLYLLGASLYKSGQVGRCIEPLDKAIAAGSSQTGEIHMTLAKANRLSNPPNLEAALKHIDEYLADSSLSDTQQHEGLIQRAMILFDMGHTEQCQTAIGAVPSNSPLRPSATVLRGRLFIAEAERLPNNDENNHKNTAEVTSIYEQAVAAFDLAKQQDSSNRLATDEANYWQGICYYKLGEPTKALTQLSSTHKQNFDLPIGIAAGLWEADVLRSLGRYDESVEQYVDVMQDAGEAQTYSNPWVSIDELHQRIRSAFDDFRTNQLFENALELGTSLGDVFSKSDAYRWQAELHRQWGEHLLAQAIGQTASEARKISDEGRVHHRKSGRLYEQLANLLFSSRNYSENVWKSAEGYLKGRDFRYAVRMLDSFVQNAPRSRWPAAQVAMGQAHLALGDMDRAIAPLLACIQFAPNDPVSYKARLLASHIYVEMNKVEQAKEILSYNLDGGVLSPDSLEWRDSQLQLSRIYAREGAKLESQSRLEGVDQETPSKEGLAILEKSHTAYQQAIVLLERFVERHELRSKEWATPIQYTEARFLLAEARRQAARWPRKKLSTVTISTTRAALTRQIQNELRLAHDIYEQLKDDLRNRQDQVKLTNTELGILRNCYFAQADVLFDMNRYDEAIEAYTTAVDRYDKSPESLEALLQIANSYRRINRPMEARGMLQRAKVVLSRLSPDIETTKTTRFDRKEWGELLDWLIQL